MIDSIDLVEASLAFGGCLLESCSLGTPGERRRFNHDDLSQIDPIDEFFELSVDGDVHHPLDSPVAEQRMAVDHPDKGMNP